MMATSSIYVNVRIKNKTDCKNLVTALEHAQKAQAKEVVFSRPVETLKGEKIKDLFEE
ncbi:hypothetical protein [Synergistes jonesii]|uniref:hypothetical protein n=1 Tax=Synergistes jonesii TaxID=2754 RepID=UPI00248E49FB|nr:hypothetical protein [Synergistes jonesii]